MSPSALSSRDVTLKILLLLKADQTKWPHASAAEVSADINFIDADSAS